MPSPDRGYSAAPLLPTRFDGFNDQFAKFGVENDLATLNAQKDILSGDTDLMSPEGRDKRLNYMLRGVVSPQQEHLIQQAEYEPAPNKYSQVDPVVVQATNGLESIDPTAPDAWEKMTGVLSAIDQDPVLSQTNIKSHPYFREALKDLKHTILTSRVHAGTTHANTDRTDINAALKEGANFADIEPFLDEKGDKITDRKGFLGVRSQAAQKAALLKQHGKKLTELATKAQSAAMSNPSDEAKTAWMEQNGVDPAAATKGDWDAAYHALKTGPMLNYHQYLSNIGLGETPANPNQAKAPTAPPDAAILLLKQRPELSGQFDAKYGDGMAIKILGGG